MAQNVTTAPLPALTTFVGGQRSQTKIIAGKRTGFITFVITLTVTLAGGPATAILNGGDPAALFQYVGLDENGYDAVLWDARSMKALSQITNPGNSDDAFLTNVANGAYALRSVIRIPFAWPLSGAAWETSYVEKDPTQDTFAYLTPRGGGALTTAAGLLVTTPGTAAITNMNVNVYQEFDDDASTVKPIFVPRFRIIEQQVPGSGNLVPFYIRSGVPLAGLLLQTDTTTLGEQTDIITSLRHLDASRTYVGPRNAVWSDLVAMQRNKYAGLVSRGPYWFQDYRDGGRLSMVWNPERAGQDLRFETNQQVSATVGAGTSIIRCGVIELNKIQGRTREGAPFPY